MAEILLIIAQISLIGFIFFVIYVFITLYRILKLPATNPKKFLKRLDKKKAKFEKIIVLLGDSITHGTVSANYCKILQKRMNSNIKLLNVGINADTTFNVLKRIDYIIKCKPDIITILIGTNNVLGTTLPDKRSGYIKLKKNPSNQEYWTLHSFKEELCEIINRLKSETSAKIALLSIPIIGEDVGEEIYANSIKFSAAIKKIAEQNEIKYLPVNEMFREYLERKNVLKGRNNAESDGLMIKGSFLHYFGMSWNKIAKRFGYHLLTDSVHLNTVGAEIIADLIGEFIKKNITD